MLWPHIVTFLDMNILDGALAHFLKPWSDAGLRRSVGSSGSGIDRETKQHRLREAAATYSCLLILT